MAVNTLLLDFSVSSSIVNSLDQRISILREVENIIRDYLPGLTQITELAIDDGYFRVYKCENGAIITSRIYKNGIITINIEYYRGEKEEPMLTYEKLKSIEADVLERVKKVEDGQAIIPLHRGTFSKYYRTSDERLLEYDIDYVVSQVRTNFQKVQILHSKSLGNMLVLDELQNISEADLIYTETLMARGVEDYTDKEIVILGGGDGALLYELLKEKPKFVYMLEIDEVVMKLCALHMRSICGDVLDNYKGSNYEIIVGDCVAAIDKFISEGRKFDYVFGDLTDIPISKNPTGEIWDFIRHILEKSFKILKPNGKFMTHGNGTSSTESLKMYESQVMKLKPPVVINKTTAFVPSFLEDWVFYQITFADST